MSGDPEIWVSFYLVDVLLHSSEAPSPSVIVWTASVGDARAARTCCRIRANSIISSIFAVDILFTISLGVAAIFNFSGSSLL